MDESVWEIAVGDRVTVSEIYFGAVVLGAKSKAWYLVRVDGGVRTDSGYIFCAGFELQKVANARRRVTARQAAERRAA